MISNNSSSEASDKAIDHFDEHFDYEASLVQIWADKLAAKISEVFLLP